MGVDRIDQLALPLNNSYTYPNTGAGVHVYGIDTGILYSHTDFGGRASKGFDAITTGGSTPSPITGVRILGSGFDASSQVRLDGQAVPSPQFISSREIDVTIPSSFLVAPRRFALDVVNGAGVVSNSRP